MEGLRVGIVQFAPGSDAGRNREYLHVPLLGSAVADVVVLPEYSAFFHPDAAKRAEGAEPLDGPFVNFIMGHAKKSGATIIAGFLEKSGDKVFNTVIAVGPSGLLGRYRKIHLYDAFGARESDFISAGSPSDPVLVIPVKGWKLGIQTCYDIRFPEVSRRLVDAGADVLVVPSDWVPGPRKVDHWTTLLTARAIENVSWVVAANHAASSGTGHSTVIDPYGQVVVEAGDAPVFLDAELNPEDVPAARIANPSVSQRRFRVVPD